MAIRDKMRNSVAPHLRPGETVQAIFGAQTTSQYFALISYWIIIFKNAYRVVAVTDQRIVVFQAGRLSTTKVIAALSEFPRATRIGPASGLWYKCEALGETLHVNKRYHKDIATADQSS